MCLIISHARTTAILAPKNQSLCQKMGTKMNEFLGDKNMNIFGAQKLALKNNTKIAPQNISAIHRNWLSRLRVLELLMRSFQVTLAGQITFSRHGLP